jgi:outer membrane receptor protein involved in Fe transport
MPKVHSLAVAPFLIASFAAPALGQEVQPAVAAPINQEGVISYTPADFAAARPNTAMDMISRLPGFTFDGGDNVRGFAGAAGNVLIDGQRPTIKTDTLSDMLSRITIDQVERIDLIRGGAPGVDMQGRTVIANVIRKQVDTFQQVLSLQGFAFAQTGDTIPGWNYQATRRSGEHQFDFQLSRGIAYDDSVGFAERTTLDVGTGLVQSERVENEAEGPVHSLRANYKGPMLGGTLSINSLLSTDEFKDEAFIYSDTTSERFIGRSANDRGEIGVNYLRPLGDKFEAEGLVLYKLAVGSGDSVGDTGAATLQSRVEAEAGESIARGVLRYTHSPALSFEAGGEVAFNYRDQQIALTVNGAPVPLPASDVRIEEERGEVYAEGTWRPNPQWSFEAGARVERSTLTQSGQEALERSFDYPKPRLLATWSPTNDDQVRVRIEREVGQLDLREFATSVDLNAERLDAGNANLEPDKRWVYEAAFEKRFWDKGAIVATLRHEDVEDVLDQFPFLVLVDDNGDGIPDDNNNDGQPDVELVAGLGNIGDGTNDVAEISLTLPLGPLGLEGGEIKATGSWAVSEVTDPLTGDTRRISGQRPDNLSINFRQDLPAQHLTFGLGWFGGWEEDYYYLEEVLSLRLEHFYSSFVEWKPNPNFTLRAELNNYDPYRFTLERFIYDSPRDTGALVEIERERRKSQMIGRLSARWTFG